MGAALVLVAATAVGGSLAAGQIEGDRAVGAPLAATTLQIGWADGQTRSPAAEYQLSQPVMPGDTVALADATGKAGVYSVQNTGSVAAYVRVTVTKYWADEEGEGKGKRTDLDGSAIQVSAPADSGWLESNPPFSSGETQTFYFQMCIRDSSSATASTPAFKAHPNGSGASFSTTNPPPWAAPAAPR